MGQVEDIFSRFSETTCMVVGDIMLDTYLWGSVGRMSPEVANVPIVNVERREHRLGGAANVALNLVALGAEVLLCGTVGKDADGAHVQQLLAQNQLDAGHILALENRPTTVKTRVMDGTKQLLRFDQEQTAAIQDEDEAAFLSLVSQVLTSRKIDVLIFQDYNKGLLSESVIKEVLEICHLKGIATAVDPKKDHFFGYRGATLFKPNLKEVRDALGREVGKKSYELEQAAREIHGRLNNQLTLITLSEAGMFVTDHHQAHHLPAHARHIVDVSGAGDTVIAVAALALAQGLPHPVIAALANIAGGMVCEQAGVSTLNKQAFQAECLRLL
ncbi:MAG: bifunctional ADP-heptose synthase [Chitinophagales bacterium]|nr:bifunctional ADP-heptose synthase [Chitinophagales bacterium]